MQVGSKTLVQREYGVSPKKVTKATLAPNLQKITSILANMYSDVILATVRELVCNAWDSHVLAGKAPHPIKVTAPTALDPCFRVRDYGVGMDDDTVHKIFPVFGLSTKDKSNESIGGFGIGAAAPTNYAGSVTIKCYDGETLRVYHFVKGDHDILEVQSTAEIPSTEPRGVEVSVPVSNKIDYKTFSQRIETVLQWFPKDSYQTNVTIEMPKIQEDKSNYIILNDPRFRSTQIKILCGNILYNISEITFSLEDFDGDKVLFDLYNYIKRTIIIKANIGDVSIAPNRESVILDYDTKAFITSSIHSIMKSKYEEMDMIFKALSLEEIAYDIMYLKNNYYHDWVFWHSLNRNLDHICQLVDSCENELLKHHFVHNLNVRTPKLSDTYSYANFVKKKKDSFSLEHLKKLIYKNYNASKLSFRVNAISKKTFVSQYMDITEYYSYGLNPHNVRVLVDPSECRYKKLSKESLASYLFEKNPKASCCFLVEIKPSEGSIEDDLRDLAFINRSEIYKLKDYRPKVEPNPNRVKDPTKQYKIYDKSVTRFLEFNSLPDDCVYLISPNESYTKIQIRGKTIDKVDQSGLNVILGRPVVVIPIKYLDQFKERFDAIEDVIETPLREYIESRKYSLNWSDKTIKSFRNSLLVISEFYPNVNKYLKYCVPTSELPITHTYCLNTAKKIYNAIVGKQVYKIKNNTNNIENRLVNIRDLLLYNISGPGYNTKMYFYSGVPKLSNEHLRKYNPALFIERKQRKRRKRGLTC